MSKLNKIKHKVMAEALFFCDQLDCLDKDLPVCLEHTIQNNDEGFSIAIKVDEL